MSQRSYLCMTNENTIYPSTFEDEYQSDVQTIANDVEAIPVLWLSVFRSQDMTEKIVDDGDGGDFFLEAPITTKKQALANIESARPLLREMFSAHGNIDEYADLFRKAIEQAEFEYITIEFYEISEIYSDDRVVEIIKIILNGWQNPEECHINIPDEEIAMPSQQDIKDAFDQGLIEIPNMEGPDLVNTIDIDYSKMNRSEIVIQPGIEAYSLKPLLLYLASTELDDGEKLPSARMYLDDMERSDEDVWNFTRFLGAGVHGSMGLGAEVPWEREDVDYGFELKGFDDEDDEDCDEDFSDDDD